MLTFAGLAIIPGLHPHSHYRSNERNASASLKSLVTAQENFRHHDLDRNGVNDYWTGDVAGLFCLRSRSAAAPGVRIDSKIASADSFRLDDQGLSYANDSMIYDPSLLSARAPSAGYWYQALKDDVRGKLYGEITDESGVACHNLDRFEAVAFPAEWDATGNRVFIVNHGGGVFGRDYGSGTPTVVPGKETVITDWHVIYISWPWGRFD